MGSRRRRADDAYQEQAAKRLRALGDTGSAYEDDERETVEARIRRLFYGTKGTR